MRLVGTLEQYLHSRGVNIGAGCRTLKENVSSAVINLANNLIILFLPVLNTQPNITVSVPLIRAFPSYVFDVMMLRLSRLSNL
jgi:hypothetical protein